MADTLQDVSYNSKYLQAGSEEKQGEEGWGTVNTILIEIFTFPKIGTKVNLKSILYLLFILISFYFQYTPPHIGNTYQANVPDTLSPYDNEEGEKNLWIR